MAKIGIEKILLLTFFIVMLYLGPGILFDHKIKHDFPFAYGASDAFQHQVRTEAIKDIGNRFEAPYIVKGFKDFVIIYPPVMYQLAIMLSYSSGLEIYDAIYFVVVFFAVIAALIMYFVIKEFNKTVAILSLPLSILIFSFPASTGFLWGHWPSVLSQSFVVLVFWSILRREIKHSFILIAIAISATALTHTSETIFAIIFMAIFFGLRLAFKKLTKREFINMALAGMIFLIISFYYLVIFINTWAVKQPFVFAVQPLWDGNPGFYIAGFGLLLIPIAIGLIFSISEIKALHVAIIAPIVMLIGSYMNYIGFEVRSFQLRFFWPIYLSFFLGFGIYATSKFAIKKWNLMYASASFIILLVLFSGIVKFPALMQTDIQTIPYIPYLNRETSPGLMSPFHWESLSWIRDNTPKDATVYFFYGDIYSQDAVLRNTKRIHQQVDPEDFVKALQERKIKKEYITEFPGDTAGSFYQRPSFFHFTSPDLPSGFNFGLKSICNFDYYVFDKVSRQNVLAQYNLLIANEMLKKGAEVVFENEAVVVLKSNNVGGDCIEEGNF
ncbi:hypothetical protein HYW19_01965 [Candidatus Woesearchaeota archaeon]|nr:hypothetical protein [Candidatus Woesearchaeota archaeon]